MQIKVALSHQVLRYIYQRNLSWNKQIDDICTKLARANGILSKLRPFVPRKTYQYISLYFTRVV